MRLPTQILLLGAILTNGARASETAPAAPAAPAPGAPVPVPAAEATPPVQLEPLRVTADLWESPLERIAASVSVYDAETLEGSGVRHFGDLADQIPNLTYTGGTSRPRYFQIRGIGENSQFEGESPDSTVRFLVDDLDFTGLGSVGSTFDVKQVEVLRGPQAGAFGANAAGGVIRLVTNDPTPYATGQLEGSVGSDHLREAGAAVGGPVLPGDPEKLMFRVAVEKHESDGFRRNAFLDADTNARDELMSRLKLTWNPSAAWRWDGAVFYADADNGYDEFALDNNGRFTYSDQPGQDRQESVAGSLRGTYTGWQDVRLTTVTTGTWTDSTYSYDSDWNSVYTNPDAYKSFAAIDRDRTTAAEELRFDSVDTEDALGWIDRWTLGAYFSYLGEESTFATDFTPDSTSDYVADNYALFGQAAHDFTERTRLILGLRTEYIDQHSRVDADASGTVDFRPKFNDTLFGGKLTLEQDLSPRQVVFVSVARGYKGGGVSVDANIDPATDPLTFRTEELWNYEAGLRGRWWEDRLTGELTVFHLDRRHTQVRGSVGDTDEFRYFTANGEDAEVDGLESALTYHLTETWSVYSTLALMHSHRDTFTLPNGTVAEGRELAATPAYGYTLGLRHRAPRGWFGNVELVARGDYYESESNDEKRDAFQVVNASLGYAWREWTFTLWGRNLFDEEYAKRVFFFGNDPVNGYAATRYESRADPRQVGVSAAYQF